MGMSKEAKQKRLEYMREWRKNNKDKVKKHITDYWERKADEDKEDKEDEVTQ